MWLSRIIVSVRSTANLNLVVGRRWLANGSTTSVSGFDSGSTSSSDSDDSGSEYENGQVRRSKDTRDSILKAALEFVPSYGWSTRSLSAGAEKLGLPLTTHGMFSRGGADLVLYFIRSSNEALEQKLADDAELAVKEPEKKKGTRAIIKDAVELRLRMIIPFMNKWPQAMGLMALPQNAPDAIHYAMNMVDDIWYFAGDRSTDLNWYTKRAILFLVYGNTELFMLQDLSDDFERTWQFLDRRIDNLTSFGKGIRECQENSKMFCDLIYSAFHVARNVVTMNESRR